MSVFFSRIEWVGLIVFTALAGTPSVWAAAPPTPSPDQVKALRDRQAERQKGELAPLLGQWRGVRRDGSGVLVSLEEKDNYAAITLDWVDADGKRVTGGSKEDALFLNGFTRFEIVPDPPLHPQRRDTWRILIKLEDGKLRLQRVSGIENETIFLTKVKGEGNPPDAAEPPISADATAPFVELTSFAGRRKSLLTCAALSPDGKLVAMAAPDIDGEAVVLDIESRRELVRLRLEGTVETLVWSSDGGSLIAGSATKDELLQVGTGRQVGVWDTSTWEQRALLEHPHHPESIACSADGRIVAAAAFVNSGQVGFLQVWDSAAQKELVALREAHAWAPLVVTPKGDALLCGINSGKAKIVRFALPSGKQSAPKEISGGIAVMALTRDGRGLATAGPRSGDVQLWGTSSLRPIRAISGFPGRPYAICFLNGADYVAVAGSHENVFVFDTKTGKLAYEFPASRERFVFTLGASADSSRLLSWSSDYVARIWRTPFGKEPAAEEDDAEAAASRSDP